MLSAETIRYLLFELTTYNLLHILKPENVLEIFERNILQTVLIFFLRLQR